MSNASFVSREEFATPTPFREAPQPVLFTGEDREFHRLVMFGALLEILTAGFYRFWLATKMRRYLWSHTIIGGDALEYVGGPRELIFGFFFSLVILAPADFADFLLSIEAERYAAYSSLLLILIALAFSQFAIYGARRYRLEKTIWRGLRFDMGGSRIAYMMRAIGWGAACLLSIGVALPWALTSLESYKMRNTSYGDLRGDFVGCGRTLFQRGWKIWALSLAGASAVAFVCKTMNSNEPLFILTMLAAGLVTPALYTAYRIRQVEWWLEGLRLGEMKIETRFSGRELYRNACAYFLIAVGVVLAVGLILIAYLYFSSHHIGGETVPPKPATMTVALFFVAAIGIGVTTRIFFIQRFWKIVARSSIMHGLETAENVPAAAGGSVNAINEGFADSLDVAGF